MVEIKAFYPVAQGNTLDNLKAAAEGEHEEWQELYPEFGRMADAEGFPEIGEAFRKIADAEVSHETRYRKLAANIENSRVFARDTEVSWKCGNCGYIHEGAEAPQICAACIHPQAHFEVFSEAY